MLRKTFLSLAVIGALCFAGQSFAANTTNVNFTGTKISFGYVGYHLHYKESSSPSDKDTAWMNGGKIKVEHISESKGFLGHRYAWGTFMYAVSSNGKYHGASQDLTGDYHKFDTNTDESIERGEFGFGVAQITKDRFVTKESVVIGEQWWFRKIKDGTDSLGYPVKGYEVDYGNMYAGLQLEGDYYFSNALSAGLVVMGAVSPKSRAFNQAYNKLTGDTYKMGKAYRWKIALPISYETGRLTFNITPFYSGWLFHKSDKEKNYIGNGVYVLSWEPSSRTKETGFYADISYRF